MPTKIIELNLPTGYSENELKERIAKECGTRDTTWQIESKSLDARKKGNIHWQIRVAVSSPGIGSKEPATVDSLEIPYIKRNKRVVVAGSGPAGFFAAFVLQKAGFDTMILERGSEVDKRAAGITNFEHTGEFNPQANYSFGEGGAGTFSDGKLTSRSKHISPERDFFLNEYIVAGAPAEIRYMTHPHVGSDNLKQVVRTSGKNIPAWAERSVLKQHFQDCQSEIILYRMRSPKKVPSLQITLSSHPAILPMRLTEC
jgi:uncharacterized protein